MPLVVYKSSAGSGKTTTLVKAYLKITIINPSLFRNVLAITFTNKAANEMKSRVLEWLQLLTDEKSDKPIELIDFQKELEIKDEVIQKKARKLLSLIIHNYDEFSISTIDSFVHGIIKTFATDIKLPQNFEVVIEEDEIIPEIIQELYEKVGVDKDVTNILVNFVISNFEDEKSHDPTSQLHEFIQKQIKEEGFYFIRELLHISLSDFQKIIQKLRKLHQSYKKEICELACEAIDLIQNSGIESDSFYQTRSGIFKYFSKVCILRNDADIIPNSYVLKTINEDKWYSSKCSAVQKAVIDAVKNQLEELFWKINALSKKFLIYSLVYRKIYDVALIKEIRLLFDDYANRNQKVHISEFNKKISESIAGQPVPFIYERLGRKYQYFLIDEFQDTSVLQWQNLLPLIEESLAYGNFNMLVGDAKQAIYRFRNGEVELFSSLPKFYPKAISTNEIASEKFLESHYDEIILEHNFRSDKVIVDFNNQFFRSMQEGSEGKIKRVYKDHQQIVPDKKEEENKGYVKIELIETEDVGSYRELRLEKIKSNIDELKQNGYQNKDICVLTNKNEYAAEIASYLIENKYEVISHESLLLKNAPEVRMIVAFMKLLINETDQIQLANFIENLLVIQKRSDEFHQVYLDALNYANKGLNRLMRHLGFSKIRENDIIGLAAYELTEYAILKFFGNKNNNIFLHFFLDFAYDNQLVGDGSLSTFIDYWEKKCEKTYITMPDGVNAIRIMSIHKAKGLKFQSVVLDFIPRSGSKSKVDQWTHLEIDEVGELQVGMLPLVKDLEYVGLDHIYTEEIDKTELDLLNMVYVAFTRPVSALYIVSHRKAKTSNQFTKYIQKFISSQSFSLDETEYKFGILTSLDSKVDDKEENKDYEVLKDMLSTSWKAKIEVAKAEPIFWEQIESKPAHTYGKLIHKMLSEIIVDTDVNKVVIKYLLSGIIDEAEAVMINEELNKVVNNGELRAYFSEDLVIKNETEIITVTNNEKSIQRPDRVVISGDELVIIDYKTGERNNKHNQQILDYANFFSQMGYHNIIKMLVYINDKIEIVNL